MPVNIDHQIALGFARITVRSAFTTLLQLDTRLGQIVTQTREVTLGKIKLQWWHDQLAGALPPAQAADPLINDIFNAFRYHDVTFEMMARLTQGWSRLLEPLPFDREQLLFYAHERGAQLFEIAAIVAGCSSSPYLQDAGAGWALADFGVRCGDQNTAKLAKTLATETLCARPQRKLHRDLRPFALLAHFSAIDMQSDIDKLKHKSPRRRAWEAFQFSFSR